MIVDETSYESIIGREFPVIAIKLGIRQIIEDIATMMLILVGVSFIEQALVSETQKRALCGESRTYCLAR